MASLSLTWHALHDGHKICPVCLDMDGYTWTFEVGKDEFPDQLVHPAHGLVWDKVSGSMAHEHGVFYGACKCGFTFECELQDLLQKADAMLALLKQILADLDKRETGER